MLSDMSTFCESLLAGLAANAAFLVFLLAIGSAILYWRASHLRRFWALLPGTPVHICVSHLNIQTGGARDWQGAHRTFSGGATPLLETECASRIASLFASHLPGRTILPDFLSTALLAAAEASVVASPPGPYSPSGATIVALGGPGYNSASHYVASLAVLPITWGNGASFSTPQGSCTLSNRGFIVRVNHSRRSAFWAAGLSEAGTAAAAHYLGSHWRALARQFGSRQFYIVVEFAGADYTSATPVEQGEF